MIKKENGIASMDAAGYEKLAAVLMAAFAQASNGKGKERHASDGVPFELQPMSTINMEQGSIDSFLYQARKKALESKRLPPGRAQAELMGAIVYLAGAVIALDTWAAHTLPDHEARAKESTEKAEQPAGDGWIEWGGGVCPVPGGTLVEVQFRNGLVQPGRALIDSGLRSPNWGRVDVQVVWSSEQAFDIVRYRVLS